jgi:hypothetical protein
MEFLQNNWTWNLVVVFFVLMFASGLGCGGCRGHAHGSADDKKGKERGGSRGCC